MNRKYETVFLTVGTAQQKRLCEKMISGYQEKYGVNIIVSADSEHSERIGSGGALLDIIGKYYNTVNKMLVINSGGQSKRTITGAVRGKAFADIQNDGQTITLLEHILINAKRLLALFDSGILVCCSDILINTENIDITFDNNIGFCVPADIQTATRHGVMFGNSQGLLASYPHKCSIEQLREAAAKYNTHKFLIDTGVIYLQDAVCSLLHERVNQSGLISYLQSNHIELNFYGDIIPLFSQDCTKPGDLPNPATSPAHEKVRQMLFDLLSAYSLKVCVLNDQTFCHFGSMREALSNTLHLAGKTDSVVKLNSFVENGAVIGKNTVLDNAIIKEGCTIGENCFISDITLDNGSVIPDNRVVCGIKLIDNTYVCILCDADENPKQTINGTTLWDAPRFYKGKSFSDSLQKLTQHSDDKKYSMQYCITHADYDYYHARCLYISDMNAYKKNPVYTKYREEIINNYIKNKQDFSVFHCKKDRAEIQLPVRVNLSGTWTDAMPYCIENGGQVINMAVTVNGAKPIRVTVEKIEEKRIEFISDDAFLVFDFCDGDTEDELSDFNLHTAALRSFGITEKTVLQDGFRLSTNVNGIDKGSGLGTSSILLAGCLKALADITGTEYDNRDVLQAVFVAEQIMGTGGGWQDQVGGLFPAMKISTTQPSFVQIPQIQLLQLPSDIRAAISERMILIPTGQRHFGRFIVHDVADRYLSGDQNSISAFRQLTALNDTMLQSIKNNDYNAFLFCINRHFDLLKQLSPMITNTRIATLTQAFRKDLADAVSVCGAGGGGYLLAFLKQGFSVADAQQYLDTRFPSVNGLVKKIDIAE